MGRREEDWAASSNPLSRYREQDGLTAATAVDYCAVLMALWNSAFSEVEDKVDKCFGGVVGGCNPAAQETPPRAQPRQKNRGSVNK